MSFKPVGRHWAEVIVAASSALIGLVIAAGQISALLVPQAPPGVPPAPHWQPSASIAELPCWQAWVLSVLMVAGGAAWSTACLWRFEDLRDLWMVQRIGAGLSGLAWTCYGLAGLLHHPDAVVSWLSAISASAICAAAVLDSMRSERQTRDAVRRAR